jgi:hypothetical protein
MIDEIAGLDAMAHATVRTSPTNPTAGWILASSGNSAVTTPPQSSGIDACRKSSRVLAAWRDERMTVARPASQGMVERPTAARLLGLAPFSPAAAVEVKTWPVMRPLTRRGPQKMRDAETMPWGGGEGFEGGRG